MSEQVSHVAITFDLDINQDVLNSLNIEQSQAENRENLLKIGGIDGLINKLKVNVTSGLTNEQVLDMRQKFGDNHFPESPMESYFSLLIGALSDSTLLILLAAASVSLVINIIEEGPQKGWIEGGAIFIAVVLVSNIAAANDYTKELQFRALEATSSEDERCSVLRDFVIHRINPMELVIGDIIVLQVGDQIPADCVMIDNNVVASNEASLTGEPEDLRKSKLSDCFLLSSCLITEGEQVHAMVIAVGKYSQWGKIKANLVTEAVNTPLQDKLEDMTKLIGYIGMVAAFGVFAALVISIWTRNGGNHVDAGFIDAFILAVTIVVVAIPEGLPLAVTISLAFSTRKMYKDQCFIRVLAACETMGNATNICSDKTGTLTENRMTVVEGWFADTVYDENAFQNLSMLDAVEYVVVEQCCINRTAYLVCVDTDGNKLERPLIIGNKTEGALVMMAQTWGYNYNTVQSNLFHEERGDKVFSFNSVKKRSTAVIHRDDGSVRLYCKGASEVLLRNCSLYLDNLGRPQPMTPAKKRELDLVITHMADRALRTLVLAHKDFSNADHLPSDWEANPPDTSDLCCDAIVGIIDPLRSDVKEAVAIAQHAGVIVRMVTGDNIVTASAIAKQCGILTPGGIAIDGSQFRRLTPKELDSILPRLQVVARSSPEDKYLLVTRLNGHFIPADQTEWEEKFKDRNPPVSWDLHRDMMLPGYREEWETARPEGGEVVGVTGDGTNDAPALKAADVGLAMGITGTKVAHAAADIVIRDDRFSSIIRSIMWGRAVYDNIRKFLQFQLTVNIVALLLVFIGAAVGFGQPLNAVQMLWVNLIMDTLGALALGTEPPTIELLNRKPYKRNASLISRPMWRNILVMSTYQLVLLLVLLFQGPQYFHIISGVACGDYSVNSNKVQLWDVVTGNKLLTQPTSIYAAVSCNDFSLYCSGSNNNEYCYQGSHKYIQSTQSNYTINGTLYFSFNDLNDYFSSCLVCQKNDYTHGTILFNTFIFCQIFNEYTSRSIFNDWNVFTGLHTNPAFLFVSLFTFGAQILLVNFGGEFMKTTPLSMNNWLITIGLGFVGVLVGILMRLIPVDEDPNTFFDSNRTLNLHNSLKQIKANEDLNKELTKIS